jgi:hypothetical protein
MPPARREQDPRTGRYISSRENTEDLAGPLGSEPGAFDQPTKTTPGADETVEILEGIRDETRSASDIRTEDPSEQLQDELVLLAMARGDQPSLPPLNKGKRIKLVRVKYKVLSKLNICL